MARSTSGRGRKTGGTASGSDHANQSEPEAPGQPGDVTGRTEGLFTDAGSVTLAALLHLLRLTGAELVLGRRDLDSGPFENAVRVKIDQFTGPTASPEARAAGLAFARHLVEQVLAQIRAQAEVKKSLNSPDANTDKPNPQAAHPPWKLLN